MANDLVTGGSSALVADRPRSRALAILDQPLNDRFMTALEVGQRASAINGLHCENYFGRDTGLAKQVRAQHLALFEPANRAMWTLHFALNEELNRKLASVMIAAMLAGLRVKGDRHVLLAELDLLEGDDIARVTHLWEAVEATPVTLALGCRKVIATQKWVQPCELAEAVREARRQVTFAMRDCEGLIDLVRQADAALLEFAPREHWIEPYQAPEQRSTLELMLRLHEGHAALSAMVKREQANLKRGALVAPVEPKRIAACKTTLAKRTRKPKREG